MKRLNRLLVKGSSATYHCISRTVNGEVKWDDVAKEVLRKQLWQAADFCGLQILTYCIMSNHFHVLVAVPEKEAADSAVTDQELLRRYQVLYPKPTVHQQARVEVLERLLKEGGEAAEALRASLKARMHDLPEFMRTVKQRFSVWFNRRHERFGTLWAERYRSVLVQGEGNPLLTMALYIDLNPVRAGIVEDPKDYRFCGYGEAVAGQKRAKAGLEAVVSSFMGSVEHAMPLYRKRLFGRGSSGTGGKPGAKMDRKKALKVLLEEEGELGLHDVLLCRCRYFSYGAVLGGLNFVQEHMQGSGKSPVEAKGFNGLHLLHRIKGPVFG